METVRDLDHASHWFGLRFVNRETERQYREWQNAASQWQRISKQPGKVNDPRMTEFRWMLEELRVSLFAQDLKAALPVSDKRIADQIEKARVEVQRAA